MNGRLAIVTGERRGAVSSRLLAAGLVHEPFADADVFTDVHMPRLSNPRGPCMVFGRIFRRSDSSVLSTLDTGLAHAVSESGGQYLLDNFWGAYVALAGGDGRHGTVLLRDPSAQLPLYRWVLDGCELYFSDFPLACRISAKLPTIDWEAVAHRLRYPALRIAATGLDGIDEMLPGSRIGLSTRKTDQLWTPWAFIGAPDAVSSPEALAATIDACTHAWAREFRRIDVELSGGLDSSIIVASMGTSASDWRCVTYATNAPEGDERSYARPVAQCYDASLEEMIISATDLDPLVAPSLRVRPGGFGILGAIDKQLGAAARESHAGAIFSGGGGDNIFCKTRTAGAIVDAFLSDGPRRALSVSRDLAELCETSLWDAMRHALRQWRNRRTWSWPATDTLLTRAARVRCRGHPWLEAGATSFPGKRAHIAGLVGVLPFLDAYDRGNEFPMIFPLLSQPVVEQCLAVPSWRWIEHGRDRSFARDAFEARLPTSVIQRRSKGGLRAIMVPAFERARHDLEDLLCAGRLADKGLIDRAATRAVLQSPLSADSSDYVRVFELTDVELWVRSIERLSRLHR